jgi:hypothetical protein
MPKARPVAPEPKTDADSTPDRPAGGIDDSAASADVEAVEAAETPESPAAGPARLTQADQGLFTSGELLGIPEAPLTAQEHSERLGDQANTPGDIGWMLGTVKVS